MSLQSKAAPARLRCAGALVLVALLFGCKDSPLKREQSLDVGTDTIKLAAGTDIHDITIKSETGKDFAPASLQAKTGDVLRFTTADSRTHVVTFDVPVEARQVFESKSQLRSPPLLVNGVQWIVSLEGAPRGEYGFRCETHGYRGAVAVR